ncbi:core-2/I-branching enzyme [Nissabacter archeti]|uniref:Peptide O-xylosyltransferase n=1 Tax=Nissabacter archeti TaxID=1917880 RepID=A0ABS5JK57_9GAMM|nr:MULTISPECIES: beta-1,6-N-acetylglucosaminyltransferase [Yersiniaceae]MBS0970363.1 core-2/I-branching enzyme [Nissabacter archeti]PLR37659.1 core-2/I-branching enzyme [Chimaeribacter arupi]
MRKLFIMTAHQCSRALIWTVEYLSSFPGNHIIIHYDAKSDSHEILPLAKENVHILQERIPVRWGDVSQIHATLLLLRQALQVKFDYCFFISGEDVPAVSDERMNTFLEENKNHEFIHYQNNSNTYVDPYPRVLYRYPSCFFRSQKNLFSLIKSKLHFYSRGLFKNRKVMALMASGQLPPLYKGTNWFTLTADSVKFIVAYIDTHPDLLTAFNGTFCADEIFFHSVLKLKPGLRLYQNPDAGSHCLRYIDWHSGPHYPKKLDTRDLAAISRGFYFFTRKVSEELTDAEFDQFKTLVS